ncbi:methionyl-tRNA formyltransferase, partial [bacterium]|nr:methionyl-tRNA formyltransferase [bacterium]
DFSRTAIEIEQQIRAMNPWPVAYTIYEGQVMKIWQAEVEEETGCSSPGMITAVSQLGISVATGLGLLNITEIQMPGKKKMSVSAYIRGNQIDINSILG